MYKSIYYDQRRNQIHLWGDGKHGDDGYSVHKYNKYAYLADSDGEYTSIDGVKCSRVTSWTTESEKLGLVYEHNVHPTTRFLIDKYLDSDDISTDTKVLYLDIEVAKEERYSTPSEAENTITSITYYATGDSRYTCLLLDTEGRYSSGKAVSTEIEIDIPNGVTRVGADIFMYNSERDLLRGFIGKYSKIGHNIITGWNVEFFDMPYLFNRMANVLGFDFATNLSPIGIVDVKETKMGDVIHIAGVTTLDYLFLYKKFTYTDQSNFRLDTIAKFELGRGKIEYGGDLDHLYKTDIQKFAKYNIIDVELIVAFEEKLHFIDTALGLCHKGHVQHSDIQFTSAYLDGAILTYCKRNGMVASSNRSKRDGQAVGAFVRTPTPGLYNWVYDLDLTSLYPMNIISLNISPETKYCRVKDFDEESFARGNTGVYEIEYLRDNTALGSFDGVFGSDVKDEPTQIHGSDSMKQFLLERNLSIASNGVTYSKNRQGVIPAILDKWFKERAEYKSLRKRYEKEGDTRLAVFYDQQQLITKILLNSLYGVLLLPSFRFYDKHNGEAVTLTGQSVIKWATRVTDLFYNRELGTDESYCIYTDTDSIFEPLEPLFVHRHGDMGGYTDDEIIKYSKQIIDEVQTFVNQSYGVYAQRYHNVDEHRWDIKQELIAKRAFWVGNAKSDGTVEGVKKRYAQWIVDKEGHGVNELDVKGLDVVRSNFPQMFRNFMEEILISILHDKTNSELDSRIREFKGEMDNADIKDIMLPTGVKELSKWQTDERGQRIKGTPIHVKSAMNYNEMMDILGDYSTPRIADGDKILWAYMKGNPYGYDTMAVKGFEDSEKVLEFVRTYIDRDKIFERAMKSKLKNFWLSLGWGEIVMNETSNKFFG